jgi:tRNA (guanine37-N1)-methyltransferase
MEHPALLVPAQLTAELRNQLTHVILHRPRTKSVYPVDEDSSLRKLVLRQDAKVYDDDVVNKLLQDKTCQKSSHTVTIAYKDWTADQVLQKLLPISEIPSAFETVGHIAHLNLRDDVLPFKYIVGKVILDKNAPRIQTVVNKIGSIETEYRTFGMEVIAGNDKEGWSRVSLKEEGCQYELDFRQVYWNSRLAGEHRRLVQVITREQQQKQSPQMPQMVVADLMAGVGPFAVPLTAHSNQNIVVHANDLNPTSYKYLEINRKKNKCDNLHCYQMDGRAFVHEVCDRGIEISHEIMNLPASAPEFLDAFIGYTGKQLPRIHVHCFGSKQDEAEEEAIARCAKALQCPLDREKDQVSVHIVRDVAPNKNMLCVSFALPAQVREQPRIDTTFSTTTDAPPTKRIKL